MIISGTMGGSGVPGSAQDSDFDLLMCSYFSALAAHESYLAEVKEFRSFYDTAPYSISDRGAYAPKLLSLLISECNSLDLRDGARISEIGDLVQWTHGHFLQVYDPVIDSGKNSFALLYKVFDVAFNSYRILRGSGKPVITQKDLFTMWSFYKQTSVPAGVSLIDADELNDYWEEFQSSLMSYRGVFLISFDPQEEYTDNSHHLVKAIKKADPSISPKDLLARELFLVSQAARLYRDLPVDFSQLHNSLPEWESEASWVKKLGTDRVFGDLYHRW